jgi:hypothetical protein
VAEFSKNRPLRCVSEGSTLHFILLLHNRFITRNLDRPEHSELKVYPIGKQPAIRTRHGLMVIDSENTFFFPG